MVSEAKTECLYGVVEVLKILLMPPQADVLDVGINVTQVIEQHAAKIVADQRKAQLHVIDEQGIAAEREPGDQVAWSSLVVGEGALGRGAAGKESLRERDLRKAGEALNNPNESVPCQHQILSELVVSGITRHQSAVPSLRSEHLRCEPHVDGSVDAFVSVAGIVAAILNKAAGKK